MMQLNKLRDVNLVFRLVELMMALKEEINL